MRRVVLFLVFFVMLFVPALALAAPPAKRAKVTKVATQTIPVYDLKTIRESCVKMGKVAYWDTKKERCVMRPMPMPFHTKMIILSTTLGAVALVVTAVAITATNIESSSKEVSGSMKFFSP